MTKLPTLDERIAAAEKQRKEAQKRLSKLRKEQRQRERREQRLRERKARAELEAFYIALGDFLRTLDVNTSEGRMNALVYFSRQMQSDPRYVSDFDSDTKNVTHPGITVEGAGLSDES